MDYFIEIGVVDFAVEIILDFCGFVFFEEVEDFSVDFTQSECFVIASVFAIVNKSCAMFNMT